MKATRFMRKPFFVSGHQVTEESMDFIAQWCGGHVIRDAKKPFVLVPVNRPMNRMQSEAYVGTWVLVSISTRGKKSFKIYPEELLDESFIDIPEGDVMVTIRDEDRTCSVYAMDFLRELPITIPDEDVDPPADVESDKTVTEPQTDGTKKPPVPSQMPKFKQPTVNAG